MSKDVLDKLDALLNRHKEPPNDAPTTAWMPVLTEVVKRGAPPLDVAAPAPAAPSIPTPAAPAATEPAPTVVTEVVPEAPAPAATTPPPPPDPEEMAEQILALLEPRLNQLLTREISATVRKSLDQTISELLAQLDAHVRNAVQESVRERLANNAASPPEV